jgi:hypothetical protein
VRPRARASSPPPCPAGDGAARAAHGRDSSGRRRRGPGEDHPGRRTATVGCQLRPRRTGHRSATLDLEQLSRRVRPGPGTTRRTCRKAFHNMRSIKIVRNRITVWSTHWIATGQPHLGSGLYVRVFITNRARTGPPPVIMSLIDRFPTVTLGEVERVFCGDRWETRCHGRSQRQCSLGRMAGVAVGCSAVVRQPAAGLCRAGRPGAEAQGVRCFYDADEEIDL